MAEIVADLQQRRELHDGSLPRRSSSMECSGSSGGSPPPCTSKQSESPPPKRVCFASPLEWEPREPLMASPEWNPFDDESSAEEKLKNQKPKSQPAKKARRKTILGGSPAITKRVLRPRWILIVAFCWCRFFHLLLFIRWESLNFFDSNWFLISSG